MSTLDVAFHALRDFLKAGLREDHRVPLGECGWRRFPAPEELPYSLDHCLRPLYPLLLSSVWIRKIIADKVVVLFVYWLLCQSASTHSSCGPSSPEASRFHGAHILPESWK